MIPATMTPPLLDIWQFIFVGGVAFVAAVIGGVSSFGSGLLLSPFLAPIVGIKAVVPVIAVAMTFGNLSRVAVYRQDINFRIVLTVLAAALPGVALGTWLNDLMPRDPLALVLGLFLILTIPLRRVLTRRKIAPSLPAIIGTAFLFGTVTGLLPAGGVIVLPLLLGLGLTGGGLVGTDAFIGVVASLAKVGMFVILGVLDMQLFLAGVMIGLCMIPGAYGARWLIRRLHVHVHTAIIEALVAFSGISFIWSALAG
ncbi:sulfite exporter TauE/SafE family protein [Bosea sp. 117]|uniref:sulfite exporter TauE/SafE family protein n=1 Tax=Bosea sp. 117 TaxID=1125973 RepID=UPI000494C24A|nr:sulfite exporter TauE/SafE family protein [Bosea sp. 117]